MKILLVLGSEFALKYFERLLEHFGIEFDYVRNGHDAVRMFTESPNYDLIIMDVAMEGMSGFTAIKLIRRLQMGKRPVIVGYSNEVRVGSAVHKSSGIDGFYVLPDVQTSSSVVPIYGRGEKAHVTS